MQIWRSLHEVPGNQRSVVTIGNFDGMHQGHSRVVGTCVERARKRGFPSVALTFDPHPRSVHRPGEPLELIATLEDRLDAMAIAGVDAVFVANYSPDLYMLSPEDFVVNYLVERLGAVEVVVGEDFRFGRGNSGDVETLREYGRQYGFDVSMVTDVEAPSGRRWSSSWVRELMAEGNVEEASRVLGRFPRVNGCVVHGAKRGRALGFPTANLAVAGQLVPADGVYAGWLVRDVGHSQEFLPAAISVGSNPQFQGTSRTVEAHVLGRTDLNLYGEEVTVVFVKRLRPMMLFNSVDDLLSQMDQDLLATAAILGARSATRVDPAKVTAGL
ncbi:bifunctional riboflavin kinase/FAD synthetase [Actinomyces minihominis]|uniref:bifunctional riboflavin kinase/FAD synthetase n=1 Tax=Actinomyces minihominis TaxID=2002838 RepID=UPI000C07A399|nr:bifunctional riboflavin kinase/FAD synthetase [Actinomyces minihominis]